MPIEIDPDRGRKAAKVLYEKYNSVGIHGHKEMPEDISPTGIVEGSLEHILFITLSVSIDYQRDAPTLWENSRKTFSDPETNYLFYPSALVEASPEKIQKDMQKHRLSQKPKKDAYIWRTVGVSFYKKWGSDPRNFMADCRWEGPRILERLKNDSHISNGIVRPDFPYLRGNKIGPLWLRMLKDNAKVSQIRIFDQVPIPVDIHVANATLSIGVVRGIFNGRLEVIFPSIRQAWSESVKGLHVEDRDMIALDVDEPLWHLSKYGCTNRDPETGNCPVFQKCVMRDFCIKGKIKFNQGFINLQT
jgi:hypothetical protein